MYLLYLDESGNESDPADSYFVLAGVALFERQTFFLSQAIDQIQEDFFPNHQPFSFHITDIRSGKRFWRSVSADIRDAVVERLTEAIEKSPHVGRFLYAAAVEKNATLWGEAAVEAATEQVCQRFDTLLKRQYHNYGNPQRGLLVFSEGKFDKRAKIWVQGFRKRGTTWGSITNLADIPYFASSVESRLLQAADLVAHAVWLLYEKRNPDLIRPLLPFFDVDQQGIMHGLVHIGDGRGSGCGCPACASRRPSSTAETWM